MLRSFPALICLAFLGAACGVDRESDDVLAADAESSESSDSADSSSDDSDADDDPNAVDGGDVAAEDGAGSPTTLAPAPPPTTAPDGDVALTADFGDVTVEITHGEMNAIVVPTSESADFVELAFQGVRPPDLETVVLTQQLIFEAVELELTDMEGEVSDEDLDASKERLLAQVATLYPTSSEPLVDAERLYDEVPYLQFLATYQAGQEALTAAVVEQAASGEGNPCVSHILVETEAEADDALERLADGEVFADLAVELSTGPSGPGGGELGCAPSTGYVGPFAEAVDAAVIGEVVGPVETEFGFHVLLVDRYEIDGATVATEQLQERLTTAEIVVDERLGTWDPSTMAIRSA